MKRIVAFVICLIALVASVPPSQAISSSQIIMHEEANLENGITCIDEIIVDHTARSTDKQGRRVKTFLYDDTVIAQIEITVVFRYDGSTVSVISKSVTQKSTYDGWSYNQTSFTSSGGTATLKFKLSKWLILNNSYTMSLTCDKNGNLS